MAAPAMTTALHTLGAAEAARLIAKGELSPVALVKALLDRIDAIDGDVKAWAYIDREGALAEAAIMEAEAKAGKLRGPLHGVPVGIKDVFDAAGMPTIANSKATDTSLVETDSIVAERLRSAGAIILGKCTTVEFAGMGNPPATQNPWNLACTAGGSSSGSGAAVGSRTAPLTIGTQTGGSNLRPAAYNGVSGFKGTYGRIGRAGCIAVSWSLDHPGIIARSVEDLALGFSVLAGPHERDDTLLPESAPPAELDAATVRPPRLGIVREFFLERSEPVMVAALEAQVAKLVAAGATVTEIALPELFAVHQAAHRLIMSPEMTVVHATRYAKRRDDLAPKHRASMEAFSFVPATYYLQAQRIRRALWNELAALFTDVDLLVVPTAPGAAPVGLDSTGDPSLLTPWSFVGFPASSVSAGLTPEGMPLGLQLVGAPGSDYDVLRRSAWVESVVGVLPPPPMFP